MSQYVSLSRGEVLSLQEVGKGVHQGCVSSQHAARLIELKLVYRLLGELRITAAGRARLGLEHQLKHR
jgi:hypothetical protein